MHLELIAGQLAADSAPNHLTKAEAMRLHEVFKYACQLLHPCLPIPISANRAMLCVWHRC